MVIGLLVVMTFLLLRRGLSKVKTAVLVLLRGLSLCTILFLAAQPSQLQEEAEVRRQKIVLLFDRSESMALVEEGCSRYQSALDFAREKLMPALKSTGWRNQVLLFADHAERVTDEQMTSALPDGRQTNLGGAIASAVMGADQPPLAVIALTDGAANENRENQAGLSALVETETPFIGIGVGSDQGVSSLSLQRITAPSTVPADQEFRVSAFIQAVSSGEIPGFDLMLYRDGQLSQKKRIAPGRSSRFWSENFPIIENKEGTHEYKVQLLFPSQKDLVCVNTWAATHVRISREKEFRVLFVQGALTWDFKFISRALQSDPTIRLTGLSRPSKNSVFRQNVETAGELLGGFPENITQLAPYSVVILSNLKPADLTLNQQDVLSRFCSELGGGVLMLGGVSTFDASWKDSNLERLLPVTFDPNPGVTGLDRPFRLVLSDEALRNPVFQIADNGSVRDSWSKLPTFTSYGRVLTTKPGATIWMTHDKDLGANGRRILMASQPYGAGLSGVICIQNFWRWRLARDTDPQQFDRFWQQLFRYLAQAGHEGVLIHLMAEDLRPNSDVHLVLEKQPRPESGKSPHEGEARASSNNYTVRIVDADQKTIFEQRCELLPLNSVQVAFRAEKQGIYTASVLDASGVPVAFQPIEIREINRELQRTGRDMDNLQQWAAISGGLALRAEELDDAKQVVLHINGRLLKAGAGRRINLPMGINGWVMTLLLCCMCGEWVLRRKWRHP